MEILLKNKNPKTELLRSKSESQEESRLGFTLIELLVVIAIIGLMTIIVFADYRSGEKQFLLQGAAHKTAQDVRRVQGMALASRSINGSIPAGYGIYFNLSQPNQYILFADNNGDGLYGTGDTDIEVVPIDSPITLTGISTGSPLSVVFYPPDPSVLITGNPATAETVITLNYSDGGGSAVTINKVGLIETE